ncbi:MAG: thioredoxin family protein [Fimbriimonadaceae bacterium]|nr:thioredoxin family protein [Fimbriimonadaceae bacterium]NUM39736.1 thioredoxin family protein [Armatimonadota bacterium]
MAIVMDSIRTRCFAVKPLLVLFGGLLAALSWAQEPPQVVLNLPGKANEGEVVRGVVAVTFAPHMHGYQNPPSEDWMIPVRVAVTTPKVELSKVSYPRGQLKVIGGIDTPAFVYDGAIQIPVEFKLPSGSGKREIAIDFHYQQCDENNCFPPDVVSARGLVLVEAPSKPPLDNGKPPVDPPVPDATAPTGTTDPPDPTGVDERSEPTVVPPSGSAPTATTDVPSPPDSQPASQPAESGLAALVGQSIRSGNYVVLVLVLLLIGLAINLTPCVYPMIPVTLSFFASQAPEGRSGRVWLGVMYVLGIGFTYGLAGGIAAGVGAAFGQLFTMPWFNFALGLLLIGLALSMFDLYQIRLPGFISNALGARSGAVGALIMGLLIGVAAAPCAGPLIFAVFAEAAKLKSIPLGVTMFGAVGIGLGLPYLVLASLSVGAKALPKAGGWMKTAKAVLGLLVIGFGLNYLLMAVNRSLPEFAEYWIWIAFFIGSSLYLFLFENAGATRAILAIKGVTILVLGGMAGMYYEQLQTALKEKELAVLGGDSGATRIQWIPFSDQAFEDAKASGKVIVVDGTADWCAECKVIEKNVLDKPETIVAMRDVVAIKVDWSTGVDPEYQRRTKELFGIVGLPHLVVHKPGGQQSRVFTHLSTPKELIDAIKEAQGSE